MVVMPVCTTMPAFVIRSSQRTPRIANERTLMEFFEEAVAILLPLYNVVNVKDNEFEAAWTVLLLDHFQRCKVALAASTGQTNPPATAKTNINIDASGTTENTALATAAF